MTIESVHSLPQPDGSIAYVVNGIFTVVKDDVPPSWPTAWADVQAWLAAGNKAQPYVPPAPVPPTIQQQLAALDAVVSRDVEDWYAESGKAPAYGPRAEAIAQKQALRVKLKGPASDV